MARHSQKNTDGEFGCKIDIVNASKDELIEYLCNTIQYEVEKGEDADYDLVRECSDWLDELTADEFVFTPEELAARLEALKTGKDVPIFHPHKPHQTTSVPKIKRKVFARVAILVASLMLLSIISLSVMANHAGYSSTWEYISTNIGKLFGMNPGETINEDNISVIKNTGIVKYHNMAEFLKAESLNILYPQQMPNDAKITEIRCINETDAHDVMLFVFSDKAYTLQIYNYYFTNLDTLDGYECVTINGIEYHIISIDGIVYHAICQYNGFEYAIDSPNYDDLINIINNMKG